MKPEFDFSIRKGLCMAFLFAFCCAAYSQKPKAYQIIQGKDFSEIKPVTLHTLPDSIILHRVNAGGAEHDGWWSEDSWSNPNAYVNNDVIGFTSANGTSVGAGGFFTEKSRVNRTSYNMEWDFPVLNGNHIVALYFAESPTTSQTIGSRVFDVEIEGKKVLDDFDIMRFTGPGRAVVFYISVFIEDNIVDIDLITEHGSSLISAIEIGDGSLPNMDPFISYNAYGLDRTIREGTELRIPLMATDFDSPAAAITLGGGVIEGDFYTMLDYGNGQGELIIKPGYDDAGEYLFYVESGDEDGGDTGCNACWAVGDLTVLDTPEDSPIYRVNAGDWDMVDDASVPWEVDSYGNPHRYLNSDQIHFHSASHSILSNPTDAPDGVFYKSRVETWFGEEMQWDFPVPDGRYTVKLYFVESNFNGTGERVFDVLIEGTTVLNNFDILAETSKNVPLQKNIVTDVTDGHLTILFNANIASPIITAIDITYDGEIAMPLATELAVNTSQANEQLLKQISVHPNPVEDHLTLALPSEVQGTVSIRLIDNHNRVKYEASNTSDLPRSSIDFQIDNQLPSGVYHIEVSDGYSKQYIRVLKR